MSAIVDFVSVLSLQGTSESLNKTMAYASVAELKLKCSLVLCSDLSIMCCQLLRE